MPKTTKKPSDDSQSPEQPWYKDGLKFTCTGCGDCCTGAPGYVWINKAEIQAMADVVNLDVAAFEKKYVRLVGIRKSLVEYRNGDCVFFDNQKRSCSVYEARPRQCRTWPFWKSNIRSPETWAETCQDCPGSGQGTLVPLEEIERQAETMTI